MTDQTFDQKKLVAEGWTRRSVVSEPRLSEVVETYEELGHEVLLVPVLKECVADGGAGSCSVCFGADEDPERYKVIYTRPKPGAASAEEDPR